MLQRVVASRLVVGAWLLLITVGAHTALPSPEAQRAYGQAQSMCRLDSDKKREEVDFSWFVQWPAQTRQEVLVRACQEDNAGLVEFLIKSPHVNPLCADKEGQTPAHRAAAYGSSNALHTLFYHGVSERVQDSKGRWPIHVAAEAGQVRLVASLWDDRVLEHVLRDGTLIEHCVARGGDRVLWEFLEAKKPGIIDSRGSDNAREFWSLAPPIFPAIEAKQEAFALYLLDKYPHVKDQLSGFWPVVCKAVRYNFAKFIAALRTRGKSLQDGNKRGTTAAHLAAEFGHLQLVKDAIEEDGVDVNLLNGAGWSMLHYAAMAGHVDVVAYLVSVGADPYADAGEGYERDEPGSATHTAALSGSVSVIKWFADHGFDLDREDSNGKNPLYYAEFTERDHIAADHSQKFPELAVELEKLTQNKAEIAEIIRAWMQRKAQEQAANIV